VQTLGRLLYRRERKSSLGEEAGFRTRDYGATGDKSGSTSGEEGDKVLAHVKVGDREKYQVFIRGTQSGKHRYQE
jgi:hypothetical protein